MRHLVRIRKRINDRSDATHPGIIGRSLRDDKLGVEPPFLLRAHILVHRLAIVVRASEPVGKQYKRLTLEQPKDAIHHAGEHCLASPKIRRTPQLAAKRQFTSDMLPQRQRFDKDLVPLLDRQHPVPGCPIRLAEAVRNRGMRAEGQFLDQGNRLQSLHLGAEDYLAHLAANKRNGHFESVVFEYNLIHRRSL